MAGRTCLLVFPDDWISYSPTVLNLLTLLQAQGIQTSVIAFDGEFAVNGLVGAEGLIRIHPRLKRWLARLRVYDAYRLRRLVHRIRKEPAHDHYIGVDSVGALALQAAGIPRLDFLSLEVRRDASFRRLDQSRIRRVVIQSPERYAYLFGDKGPSRVLIQNSPLMDTPAAPRRLHSRPRMVFLGNAIPSHGIFECIDFVSSAPDLTLEVCGLVSDRIAQYIASSPGAGRITVRTQYVPQADIRSYLSGFDIGICLYNVDNADFNYQSVPSGKLFNYFSVGLPVVASNLLGLQPVRDFRAGVVVESNSRADIARAVEQICADYASFSRGAAEAGNHFSFDRMARPYVESIEH